MRDKNKNTFAVIKNWLLLATIIIIFTGIRDQIFASEDLALRGECRAFVQKFQIDNNEYYPDDCIGFCPLNITLKNKTEQDIWLEGWHVEEGRICRGDYLANRIRHNQEIRITVSAGRIWGLVLSPFTHPKGYLVCRDINEEWAVRVRWNGSSSEIYLEPCNERIYCHCHREKRFDFKVIFEKPNRKAFSGSSSLLSKEEKMNY